MAKNYNKPFYLTDREIEVLGLPVKTSNRRQRDNKRYYLNTHQQERLLDYRTFGEKSKKKKSKKSSNKHSNKSIEESRERKLLEYNGTVSIQDLETAIEFFKVDLTAWEVERYVCNSWDSTNSEGNTSTNYQVKVWLEKKKSLIIKPPILAPLSFKYKGEAQMWVILGCIHRPFHNKTLWNAVLHFLKDNKRNIHGLIINGDYLDLRSLSTHDDFIPDGLDLAVEYTDGLKGLLEIKEVLGKEFDRINKVFHYGNHEDRFNRNIADLRKYGATLQTPVEALRLNEDKWNLQLNWKDGYTTIGEDTDVFHGMYYGTNPCKAHLDKAPDRNMIFNHTHRISSYTNGKVSAYNIGWLGDVNSEGFKYAHRFQRGQWENGFCVTYIDNDGNSFINPIKCTTEGFFFGGKMY